ncbi:MAG: hypothetical protein CML60_05600 [Rhodobacteraceae bacterium]|nr:hypothetical protein [Paracoccaceae bacterium]MBT25854.1 hypothetical protein [Paracoccaceae bacterium]|tara:strand:- start:19 stop:357 length:339 start_codon:yes stop_codon:yes gene_type:complete
MLAAVLVVVTGLSGPAHALSGDCAGGHCAEHVHMSADTQNAGHAAMDFAGQVPSDSGGAGHEGCNPFLCNVLAVALFHSDVIFAPSKTTRMWHVALLSSLEEPNNPDRPPNL